MSTGAPFADIRQVVANFGGIDHAAIAAVRERDAVLTKPAGSLGRLEELAEWMAGWQRKERPTVDRGMIAIFAGNHGIAERGVSAYPASVTVQMVANFTAGGAAINQLCAANDLGLKVYELALEYPTPDITEQDAFTETECAATIAYGMEAVAGGIDLLGIGEMGIGNTTVASILLAALFGGGADEWVGPGTGVEGEAMDRKRAAFAQALTRVDGVTDPLEILRRVGGREFAAMAGAIIAARTQHVPVIIDGFVATAAAAIVAKMTRGGTDHCVFAHRSAEPGHARALKELGAEPLLDLGMRLGEGSGAALAAGIIKSAVATHNDMATFAQAGVSGPAD